MEWMVTALVGILVVASLLCVAVIVLCRSNARMHERNVDMLKSAMNAALAINKFELDRLQLELQYAHRPVQINPLPGEFVPSPNREPVQERVMNNGLSDPFNIDDDSRIG